MKKTLVIVGLIALLILAFAGVRIAYAQATTPQPLPGDGTQSTPPSWGRGGAGARGGFGGMMYGDAEGEEGPMHTAMLEAMAEALGLQPNELEARLDAGESMFDVAESLGISLEDFQSMMVTARTAAIQQAVQDGLLTQEKADWMLERMGTGRGAGFGSGFGPGSGPCDADGEQSFGGRRGGRGGMGAGMWSAPQTP